MKNLLILALTLFVVATALAQHTDKTQAKYFNQPPPGMISTIFAPGIVSTPESEFGSVFSKNGNEFFYSVDDSGKYEIRTMKFASKAWTSPEKLLVDDVYSYNDPFLSPDEKRLYFVSNLPLSGTGDKKDFDIWYIERQGDEWSKPINAGPSVNSKKNEYYVSFTKNGNLYFSSAVNDVDNKDDYDIYVSKNVKGELQPAVRLDSAINTPHYEGDVFVAYDESYLIFCGNRPGTFGRGDLFISFKNANGTWTKAKNMGKAINGERTEYCPVVSHDGKYLFFTTKGDIKWVDARIIESLRK